MGSPKINSQVWESQDVLEETRDLLAQPFISEMRKQKPERIKSYVD